MDKNLNNLLRWSIENTATGPSADGIPPKTDRDGDAPPNLDALRALMMGGPSEADLMREAMAAIVHPEVSSDQKLIAWENLEMMVQNLDNANNLGPLAMWEPLVQQLASADGEQRAMAAWTIGTAVQNNEKTQEKMVEFKAFEQLVAMAIGGESHLMARKKAIYALSSGVRNYQPGLDEFVKLLPADYQPDGKLEASDMDGIDNIINALREKAKQ
jgi:hsp70-interacting protein